MASPDSGYRGPDRRVETSVRGVWERAWLVAGLAMVAAVLALAAMGITLRADQVHAELHGALHAASLALAAVIATGALVHWRAVGRALSLKASMAAVALVLVALIDLVSSGFVAGEAAAVRIVLMVSAGVFLLAAARGPEIDAQLRPLPELGRVARAIGVVAVPVVVALGLGWTPPAWFLVAGTVGAAVVWAVAGVLALRHRGGRTANLRAWFAWAAPALAAAEVVRAVAAVDVGSWLVVAAGIHVLGLAIAAFDLLLSLGRSSVGRREDVLRRLEEGAREESEDSDHDRAHAIKNALFAIEGATVTLERFDERLSPADRQELERGLLAGISTLRELVLGSRRGHEDAGGTFPIGDVVEDRAALARARGAVVEVIGDLSVRARGRPGLTGQVVENLLRNAECHGGASRGRPVTVAVESADGVVTVRVIDSGPGVAPEDRDRIFERGVSLAGDGGHGVGLSVARRLMERQGGHVSYEDHLGVGACFVVTLRSAALDLVGHRAEDVDDRS